MSSKTSAGFAHFALGPALQRGIAEAGFTTPRPIQEQTIVAALDGRDVLGLAQTGTGKTAAFALPIIERLLAGGGRPSGDPRALILAPTRELANQIDAETRLLGKFTRIKTTTVYGGMSMHKQINQLRRGTDIVVACPGRLLDLMNQGAVSLKNIETLVLDEADHMFDMGFLPDIKRILKALPAKRQNLLFSATMPKEIRGLADSILKDPLVVELANTSPAETIEHSLYPVEERRKLDLLKHLMAQDDFVSAIVFTRTKHRAKRMADQLGKGGHNAIALQGNMSQAQRDRAMEGFRRKKFDILVATDIAARGIDVAGVSHVINFDVPNTPDAYTHRIGRTGRAERLGKAFTFVTGEDRRLVYAIERLIGQRIPVTKVEGFVESGVALDESRPPRQYQQRGAPARGRSSEPRRSGGDSRSAPRGPRDERGPARGPERGNARADSRGNGRPQGGKAPGARDDRGGKPARGENAGNNWEANEGRFLAAEKQVENGYRGPRKFSGGNQYGGQRSGKPGGGQGGQRQGGRGPAGDNAGNRGPRSGGGGGRPGGNRGGGNRRGSRAG